MQQAADKATYMYSMHGTRESKRVLLAASYLSRSCRWVPAQGWRVHARQADGSAHRQEEGSEATQTEQQCRAQDVDNTQAGGESKTQQSSAAGGGSAQERCAHQWFGSIL